MESLEVVDAISVNTWGGRSKKEEAGRRNKEEEEAGRRKKED